MDYFEEVNLDLGFSCPYCNEEGLGIADIYSEPVDCIGTAQKGEYPYCGKEIAIKIKSTAEIYWNE